MTSNWKKRIFKGPDCMLKYVVCMHVAAPDYHLESNQPGYSNY